MAAATVDTVLDKLSRCHVVIFVFAFIRGLPVTWNLMMSVFVAPSAVEFRCADAVNETMASYSGGGGHQIWTNSTGQCFSLAGTNDSEPCESWVYDRSVYGKTVTEEWNMVCSNRWMVSSSQSIYLAGMVVGTVAASHISDWFTIFCAHVMLNMLVQAVLISILLEAGKAFASDYPYTIVRNSGNGSYCYYNNQTFKSQVQRNGTCELLTCGLDKTEVTVLRCSDLGPGCTRLHNNKTEFPTCCEQRCYATSACELPNGNYLKHGESFNNTVPCVQYYCNNGNLTIQQQ
ncbi:organic cation transporter-like protein [Dermacentor silvarum]|uniref:organic cation transporter-like protein n=1 Tax=Dermacentor silvarum TaxID=543639 RepID=UPI002101B0F1|nr:organic cation transporter-like protein [Dermacentor silvarum]